VVQGKLRKERERRRERQRGRKTLAPSTAHYADKRNMQSRAGSMDVEMGRWVWLRGRVEFNALMLTFLILSQRMGWDVALSKCVTRWA